MLKQYAQTGRARATNVLAVAADRLFSQGTHYIRLRSLQLSTDSNVFLLHFAALPIPVRGWGHLRLYAVGLDFSSIHRACVVVIEWHSTQDLLER